MGETKQVGRLDANLLDALDERARELGQTRRVWLERLVAQALGGVVPKSERKEVVEQLKVPSEPIVFSRPVHRATCSCAICKPKGK